MTDRLRDLSIVYSWLSDRISQEIFLNRINFLVTEDKRYIDNIVRKYLPGFPVRNDESVDDLLKKIPNDREIILYGVGGDLLLNITEFKRDARIVALCDKDIEKQREGYGGYPVISPEQLVRDPKYHVIICSHIFQNEIKQYLADHMYPDKYIYELAPYIFCADNNQYFGVDFWKYEDNEIFIDDGCCNLNSTLILQKFCKNIKKVYAFEPDPHNFAECIKVKEKNGLQQVKLFQSGTWSKSNRLLFSSSGDGSAHIEEHGDSYIDVVAVDDVVDKNEKVTLIKMDVEGAELESLKGASDCIKRDKPKLAICIYHKPEDMYEIPIYIKQLVPEYKLYIRHHSNMSGETVLYAVI